MNPYPTHSGKLSHILKLDILRFDSYTGGKKISPSPWLSVANFGSVSCYWSYSSPIIVLFVYLLVFSFLVFKTLKQKTFFSTFVKISLLSVRYSSRQLPSSSGSRTHVKTKTFRYTSFSYAALSVWNSTLHLKPL